MATVWATHNTAPAIIWTNRGTTGWTNMFVDFPDLTSLAASMEESELVGRVSRLGIVAHGDVPGQVRLDRPLTIGSENSFKGELKRLGQFLTPRAKLIFYSCIAGTGQEGTLLLTQLSRRLMGRTIVGFNVFGVVASPSSAGNMDWAPHPDPSFAQGRLHPWTYHAKWAKDGQIIRWPATEQEGRPGRRCGNPACPGHEHATHRCPAW